MTIPLARPSIDRDDVAAVARVLESGMLVQGPEVEAFERELASLTGRRHAVVVSNCTAALHTAMLGLGVGPGDLVLVPGYSWQATGNIVELAGAEVEFVDVRTDTYNIDVDALRATVDRLGADGRLDRVKAIVPVHAFGDMADLPGVLAVADELAVPVVEDAACALGAELDGRPAGGWGRAGCFSFHPRKAITTGEGGALVTDDDDLAEHARAFRNHGQSFADGTQQFVLAGNNYRMTDFQAALGRSQLARLGALVDRRRDLVERYLQLLDGVGVTCPTYVRERTACQSFVVMLPEAVDRGAVIDSMAQAGVATSLGTIAMPFTRHFAGRYGRRAADLPGTWAVGERTLALPLHHELSGDDQGLVVTALAEALR